MPEFVGNISWTSPLVNIPNEAALEDHSVWGEIADFFSPEEFNAPWEMDVGFLRLLHEARRLAEVPFRIISDARDPYGNVGASRSAHKKRPCRAVDLRVNNSYERARIVFACVAVGIRRIGVYPGGQTDGGSLHVDAETSPENPTPRIWTRY